MNSELPVIKVTNSKITDKTLNDLNKLSGLLLQKKSNNNNNMNGGKRKKSKTRKIRKSKYY